MADHESTDQFEPIARAMAEWSSDMPWEERHPKNRWHWLLVAEATMSNDPIIVERVNEMVRTRKAEYGARFEAGVPDA
jgi:hypothetical protein